jgi:hypothetical protein
MGADSIATETIWQTLNVVDTGQTISIARNPGVYEEVGFPTKDIIGSHPTESKVYAVMAAYAVLHLGVSYLLDRLDTDGTGGWHIASLAWKYGTLGNKGYAVWHNSGTIGMWDGSNDKPPGPSSPGTLGPSIP